MTSNSGSKTEPHTALQDLVHLSNRIGQDTSLVQPGGGNSSVKVQLPAADGSLETQLLVKGSGTDLRTITPAGFTQLSMNKLGALKASVEMPDEEMMQFLANCMSAPGPVPSVETPLHSILPYRMILHTHDIATMSLTNLREERAQELVQNLFEGQLAYVPYIRPGFPLAKLVADWVDRIPKEAIGLTLAHHGLVVWGDTAQACHAHLSKVLAKIDDYLETVKRSHKRPVTAPALSASERLNKAATIMPAIRGALSSSSKAVLHFDDSPDILKSLAQPGFRQASLQGMATPEHILRAGRAPLWLDYDFQAQDEQGLVTETRTQMERQRSEYSAYHARNASKDDGCLDDWAKVVLIPDLGMVTAFKDKGSARIANVCYQATAAAIENAELLGGYEGISEEQVFEFEHWPLERRKIELAIRKERDTLLLPRHVVVIIGGGSGIGEASAHRFAEEGAHVVVADLDGEKARTIAANLCQKHPERAIGVEVDVREESSLDQLFRKSVLEYGGVDCLFYTVGVPPRFVPLTELTPEDLAGQIGVHYTGAVIALRNAARIMKRQGIGGAIVASVSKAALAPGKEALAYGSSKAALQQALRVAAIELGEHQIRVNSINADQVETPLFLEFVRQRAQSKGLTIEQQLEVYRGRNALGVSLIPPKAVADIAVLLASSRFQYTTGDILTIDGGLSEAFPR